MDNQDIKSSLEEEQKRIKEEQFKLKKVAYEQWLQQPTTHDLFTVLNNHESLLIDNSTEDAARTLAAVRTVRAMRKILLNPELFISLSQSTK